MTQQNRKTRRDGLASFTTCRERKERKQKLLERKQKLLLNVLQARLQFRNYRSALTGKIGGYVKLYYNGPDFYLRIGGLLFKLKGALLQWLS